MDIRDQKLAQLITQYSVNVQPGDKVVIRSGALAEPLVKEFTRQCWLPVGIPYCGPSTPGKLRSCWAAAVKSSSPTSTNRWKIFTLLMIA